MKKVKKLLLFFICCLSLVKAQAVFDINPFPNSKVLDLQAQGDLRVLAVMVEYAEDNDGNTYGDGTFGSIYTQDYGDDIIDPLPFDQQYFEQHLEFAKNYYDKVSGGKVNLTYTVLPNIITVSKIMREYTPTINSDDYTPMGEFAEEVWGLADAAYPDIDFSQYDIFAIFHAGVGREIPTSGSLGLERDMPSVYLSSKALDAIFGDGFTGFSVDGGSYSITNTMILPCTENREIESYGEVYLQEYTINGLIVSSIASHLGLPDLYNTETGTTTIGRFGLMDGQAIFAFNGLFPPAPSPWEKMYLGWIEPVVLTTESQNVSITTYEKASEGDVVLVKIPINSSEYYLVENRKRDANNDGAVITYKIGNSTSTITFQKDLSTFISYNADTIRGVVTDVDEFDWAIPGIEDEQTFDDPFEDVGLVIWHIDEDIINANLESNSINNDLDHRGVSIVEADGIYDIGEEFYNIYGDIELGEGTKQDTWYSENPSEFYENKFNADTEPPAVTTDGANSLISLSDFSGIGNTMSFTLAYDNETIAKTVQTDMNLAEEAEDVANVNGHVFIHAGDNIYLYNENEDDEFSSFLISSVKPAIYSLGDVEYLTSAYQDRLTYSSFSSSDELDGSTTYKVNFISGVPQSLFSGTVTTPIVVYMDGSQPECYAGTEEGDIIEYTFDPDNYQDSDAWEVDTLARDVFDGKAVKQVVYDEDLHTIHAVSENGYWNSVSDEVISFTDNVIKLAVGGVYGSASAVVLTEGNNFSVIPASGDMTTFTVNDSNMVEDFVLSNLKNGEGIYIVYSYGNTIDARNFNGSHADYFPVTLEDAYTGFTGVMNLSFDLDGNGYDDIFTFDENGVVYAVDGDEAEVTDGFPISSGSANTGHPYISVNDGEAMLTVVNAADELLVYDLGDAGADEGWTAEYGNNYNNAYYYLSSTEGPTSEYFPQAKAYNWPNPVYNGDTYIRFYVANDSDVEIKIFDLAGDLVDEITDHASGGVDTEIPWNVDNIQSGVYLAHLQVNSSEGKSDHKIIKIAVIK